VKEPDNKDLDCLNSFPEGTYGNFGDHLLISGLNALCKQHGYGRVHQVMSSIEDIWRHPEKITSYKKDQEDHMKALSVKIE